MDTVEPDSALLQPALALSTVKPQLNRSRF